MAFSYYIYYRVANADLAKAIVATMQASVQRATGIAGRVLLKRDDPSTWMEVYERVGDPEAFERCLAEAVLAHGFGKLLQPGSRRHVECFEEACA